MKQSLDQLHSLATSIDTFSKAERPKMLSDWMQLLEAAKNGDLSTIKALLPKTKLHQQSETEVNKLVYRALIFGKLEIIQYLAENTTKTLSLNSAQLNQALIQTISNGHLETLQYMLQNYSQQIDVKTNQYAGMRLAAKNGHLPILKFLISQYGETFDTTALSRHVVLQAALSSQLEVLKYFIEDSKKNITLVSYEHNLVWNLVQTNAFSILQYLIEESNQAIEIEELHIVVDESRYVTSPNSALKYVHQVLRLADTLSPDAYFDLRFDLAAYTRQHRLPQDATEIANIPSALYYLLQLPTNILCQLNSTTSGTQQLHQYATQEYQKKFQQICQESQTANVSPAVKL